MMNVLNTVLIFIGRAYSLKLEFSHKLLAVFKSEFLTIKYFNLYPDTEIVGALYHERRSRIKALLCSVKNQYS